MTREQIQRIKDKYPAGTRIRLNSMDDPQPVPPGTEGEVICVDDAGQLLMKWDNGRSLSLIPGEDSFEIVEQKQTETHEDELQAETEAPGKRAEASQEKPSPASERKPEEYDAPKPVSSTGVRMLHHMSRIFRENATADVTHRGMQIDRKRRRALQEKRIAMGHKPDDHEEQGQALQ